MRYFESCAFPFRSPKWPLNALMCLVATFVPIAGQMVILGYQFEILQTLHLRGARTYPDFDFDRLMHYLLRGAWVFLALLVVSLPVGLFFGLLAAGGAVGLAVLAQAEQEYALFVVCGGAAGLYVLLLLLNALVYLVALPMALRAGLMQEFGAAFSRDFILDFIKRVGGQTILAEIFLALVTVVAVAVGLLVLCVGAYFTAALVLFIRTYLWYELYELYLQRGGMEIPLVVDAPPRPRVVYDED